MPAAIQLGSAASFQGGTQNLESGSGSHGRNFSAWEVRVGCQVEHFLGITTTVVSWMEPLWKCAPLEKFQDSWSWESDGRYL
jgi:hypothetical protein